MAEKKEAIQKDYIIHANFYDDIIRLLEERLEDYQEMDKENIKGGGESPGTYRLRIELGWIKEKQGENLTPSEVHLIFEVLLEKILGKVIE